MSADRYQSFRAFFPFYLKEHSNVVNRRLHFAGTTLVNALLLAAVVAGKPKMLLLLPLAGYGFAWVGHFIVEKNRPATFKYPLWSLMGDYKMYWMMLNGKLWGQVPTSGAQSAGEAESR
jgi:hypothetical protein